MDRSKYFDNAATTPVAPEVFAAMEPFFKDRFGNASSIHGWGRQAENAVEEARSQLADLIGAEPEEIVFTSGATEANNWVLRSFSSLSVSPFEHPSVRLTAEALKATVLKNDGWKLEGSESELTSVQAVNHETGALIKFPDARLKHSDATQAIGKVPFDATQYDFASMSAHKFYGPKGVGALYNKGCNPLPPLFHGGSHEHGFRSGTLNVPGIVGMGEAARVAKDRLQEDVAHAQQLHKEVKRQLSEIEGVFFVESENNSPYVLTPCFEGVEGESVVITLDSKGFAISSGSACSSGSGVTSHVLTAFGVPDDLIRGMVRISFGRYNTVSSAEQLCEQIADAIKNLRKLNV